MEAAVVDWGKPVRVNQTILDTVFKVAAANDEWQRARMAAALVKNNKIVSIGINRKKSDPLQAKFAKNDEAIFLHCEIHAIKTALRDNSLDDIEGSDLYICRAKKHRVDLPNRKYIDVYGLAAPCEGCRRAIAEFGIRNVVYTTDTPGEYAIL